MGKGRGSTRNMPGEHQLLGPDWVASQVEAFAQEIISQNVLDLAMVVGVRRRGAELARRVREKVTALSGSSLPFGALDITLYRDDAVLKGPKMKTQAEGTLLDHSVDNRIVFLIDDVIFTGRTIRAALDEIMDFGRPGSVRLFSFIDRGGRELPVQPDKVGKRLSVPSTDRVEVRVREVDGQEGVFVVFDKLRGPEGGL